MDVPVFFDNRTQLPGFDVARCCYFCVECDEPRAGWRLEMQGGRFPFLMLGLAGIITRPLDDERFYRSAQVEDLFLQLEEEAGLLITFGDLWLPGFLLERFHLGGYNGQVFRLQERFFASAFRFREGRQVWETFLVDCERYGEEFAFSGEETLAFFQWHDEQVEAAQTYYRENPERRLPPREDEGGGLLA